MTQPNDKHWYIKVTGTLYDPAGEVPKKGKIRITSASTTSSVAKGMSKVVPIGTDGSYEFYLATGIFEIEVLNVNVYETLGYAQFSVGNGSGSEDYAQDHEITLENLLLERAVSGVTSSTLPVLQGIPGADGRDGEDGAPGVNGIDGLDGRDGIDGIDGTNGTNGTNGTDGADGAVGATGPQGPQGVPGADGADGADGLDGTNGTNGVDGNDGAVGATGATGAQGIQGIQGDTGPQGIQGVPGADGADGADGAQGIQGIQGITGDTGPAGADGTNGTNGTNGDTIYVEYEYSVDNITYHTTMVSGDIYRRERTVTNGTPASWSLGAVIIGNTGDAGDTIWYDYQYSVDDVTWHATFVTGDKYTRSALVTNGVYGAWGNSTQIVPIVGVDYVTGSTIYTEFQYSIDGSTNWHSDPVVGDYYLRSRVVTDAVAGAWSSVLKFIPEAGVDYSTNGIDIAALVDQAEIYRDEASAFSTSASASAASLTTTINDLKILSWNGV